MVNKSSTSQQRPCSRVAILMACYNGEEFLAEQLESIQNQSHKNWFLYVADDNSSDKTREILKNFRSRHPQKVRIIKNGHNLGMVKNFLSLICDGNIKADFFSFADQDDCWGVNKIANALKQMEGLPRDHPVLYCSRVEVVDKNKKHLGFTPVFKVRNFQSALAQNIATGHTIVLNNQARSIIKEVSNEINIRTHDWWSYLVIMGNGGTVIFDEKSNVKYRQHYNNYRGHSLKRRLKRIFIRSYRQDCENHVHALDKCRHILLPENREILDKFKKIRVAKFPPLRLKIFRIGMLRQGVFKNIIFAIKIVLGDI